MNIVIIGFSGTGRTSAGRILAGRLNRPFIDTNEVMEGREGGNLARVAQLKGEKHLRDAESDVVSEISLMDNCVIAAGAHVPASAENLKTLKKNGVLICLTAEPSIILLRTTPSGQSRILLKSAAALGEIRRLLKEMENFYSGADRFIDTSDLTPEETADRIQELLSL